MRINGKLLRSTVVGALGGLLFGFDTVVISGTTGQLQQVFHLTPQTLGLTVSIALWGTVLGCIIAGPVGQRFGGRNVLRVLAVLYIISALGCAFAWSWPSLMAARFLGGLAIGGSSVLGPVYIAELAPAKWRGRLVGAFQINIVIGILVAYVSNWYIATLNLGANGVAVGARRLAAAGPAVLCHAVHHPAELALSHHPEQPGRCAQRHSRRWDRPIRSASSKSSAPPSCASGTKRPRLFHAFSAAADLSRRQHWLLQPALRHQRHSVLRERHLRRRRAQPPVHVLAIHLHWAVEPVATFIAMALIDKLGRKTLLLIGSVGTCLCLLGVALLFHSGQHQGWIVWLLVAFIGFFALSQGAVIWVYIAEVFPTPGAVQRPEPGQRCALGHERHRERPVSLGRGELLARYAVLLLCQHVRSAVLRGACSSTRRRKAPRWSSCRNGWKAPSCLLCSDALSAARRAAPWQHTAQQHLRCSRPAWPARRYMRRQRLPKPLRPCVARAGSSRASPRRSARPPITIRSGFSRSTRIASASPSRVPVRRTMRAATASPAEQGNARRHARSRWAMHLRGPCAGPSEQPRVSVAAACCAMPPPEAQPSTEPALL